MQPIEDGNVYPLPKTIRVLTAALCGIVLATSVLGAIASVALLDRPAWTFFGFQVVTAVAAVLGVVMGFGRFREGPGMALACIAGTIFVAAVLGYLSMQPPEIAGRPLKPWLIGRLAVCGILGLMAAWCVLSRDARSWPSLVKGLVLALPVVMALGVTYVPAARGLVRSLMGGGVVTAIVASVAAFVVLGSLLCASTHLVIRAFEYGRREDAEP